MRFFIQIYTLSLRDHRSNGLANAKILFALRNPGVFNKLNKLQIIQSTIKYKIFNSVRHCVHFYTQFTPVSFVNLSLQSSNPLLIHVHSFSVIVVQAHFIVFVPKNKFYFQLCALECQVESSKSPSAFLMPTHHIWK